MLKFSALRWWRLLGVYVSSLALVLHGPPMLVDKTNFGLVLYNHAIFYQFEETSSNWLVK